MRYLAEDVGLGRDGAAKVITAIPQVLSLSVEKNLRPKVMFLVEEAGAGREGAAVIIMKDPSLLRKSVELNLRPTLRFLLDNFPDISGSQAMLLASYSLSGRLVPRVRLLQRHGQAGHFAASTMAVRKPATFCAMVGIKIEEYDAEVAACEKEHAEMHPSLAWAVGAAGEERGFVDGAEGTSRSSQETVDAGVAHNKAWNDKRNAMQMAANQ